jgi:hypothetical protein
MLVCSLKFSYDAHPQLYLDENGDVDIELTEIEAEFVESAKRNESSDHTGQKTLRKRRSQASNIGIDSKELRQAAEATEFEGWVFSTFKDCKVGESYSYCHYKSRFK